MTNSPLPPFTPLACRCAANHGLCRGDWSGGCFYRGIAQHQGYQEKQLEALHEHLERVEDSENRTVQGN